MTSQLEFNPIMEIIDYEHIDLKRLRKAYTLTFRSIPSLTNEDKKEIITYIPLFGNIFGKMGAVLQLAKDFPSSDAQKKLISSQLYGQPEYNVVLETFMQLSPSAAGI